MSEGVKRGNTGLAVKAAFWYVASTFLLKSISFITTPIFSRLLSQSEFGEFANYANWQATLLVVAGFELYNTLPRAYYDYEADYDGYISSVLGLNFIITAGIYLIFLFNQSWIFKLVAIPAQYVHIMFFTMLCSSYKTIFMTRERTLYRYKRVALLSTLDTLIPTIISVILVALSAAGSRLSARVYGFYFPSALIGCTCGVSMLLKGRKFKLQHCWYALKLSLPLMIHYLTSGLMSSSNTIITKNIYGAEMSAIVSIATSVIHILTFLFQALSGALTTWLMDNLKQRNYEKLRKEMVVYIAGLSIVSLGVILLAPEAILILGGARYRDAVALIPGLVFATLIQSLTTVFTIILTYDKNVTKTAVFTGIAAVLSIIAKIVLLPVFGIQCLPAINVAVSFGLFVANYMVVVQAGYGKAIYMKSFLLSCAGVMLFVLLSFFLYNHTLIRYAICFAGIMGTVVLVLVFKNKIFEIFRKKK